MFLGETESRQYNGPFWPWILWISKFFVHLPTFLGYENWLGFGPSTSSCYSQLCIKKISIIKSHASGLQPSDWKEREKGLSLLPTHANG